MTQCGVVFGPDLLKCPWTYDAPMSCPKLISFYYFFFTYTALWMHFCVGTLWNASAMQRPETVVCAVAQLCLDFASSRVAESMEYRLLDLASAYVRKKWLLSSNSMVLFDNMVENQSIQGQWSCILQERNDQTCSKKANQRNGTKTSSGVRHFSNKTRRLGYSPHFFS